MEPIEESFEFLLQVDEQANNPTDFPPLDFAASVNHPLFSTRFQEIIAKIGIDNIQYFPAKVIYEPTSKEVGYKVANVIGAVKALDTEASKCDVDQNGFVDDFETVVIDEEVLHGLDFVRLYESLNIIIISQRVADVIIEAKLTAVLIMEPSEWEPGRI